MSMSTRVIRKGGQQTPEGFLFELSGGALALDFVNTVDNRPTEARAELLSSYERLLSWLRQVRLISSADEAAMVKRAAIHKSSADEALLKALRLREFLFSIFTAIADGEDLPHSALRKLTKLSRKTMNRFQLAQTERGLEWIFQAEPDSFDWMLWPIAYSGLTLLESSNIDRIRRCASDRCDWLFLDMSKRGNKRWCDMTVCGNRAKARRHYERSKQIAK